MAKSQPERKASRIAASPSRIQEWVGSVEKTPDQHGKPSILVVRHPADFLHAKLSMDSGRPQPTVASGSCVLAGAFNPLHSGHLEMARYSLDSGCQSVWFEICINNPDKPSLDLRTLLQRANQSFEPYGLVISTTPTFVEKSDVFPGTVFAVGADTLLRIADSRYYASTSGFEKAMHKIEQNGCRFLVFGRTVANRFLEESQINIPNFVRKLCDFVPQNEFQVDLSSSKIRDDLNR